MQALPHLAGIHVAGSGAAAFLDGQLTQRVSDLAPGELRIAAWCNPQGRVRAVLRVLRSRDQHFTLVLPRDLAPQVGLALGRFVLRAPVLIEPKPRTVWQTQDLPAHSPPQLAHGSHPRAPGRVLAVSAADPVLETTTNGAASIARPAVETTAEDAASPADRAWRLADILAGLPQVYAVTSGHWLPQNLDLEALGGLSFDKGCYPGQEIVARLHYRGTIKQRLRLLTGEAPTSAEGGLVPSPGCPLLDRAGHEVGEILDAVSSGETGGLFALAVVATAAGDAPLRAGVSGPLMHGQSQPGRAAAAEEAAGE